MSGVKKGRKTNLAMQVLLIIAILVFAGLISSRFFMRIDLTDDKRYTVSEVSKELVADLDQPVLVTSYYTGEMPPYYKYLEEGIQTLLTELNSYGGKNLEYQLINPSGQNDLLQRFAKTGFYPFPVQFDLNDTETREVQLMPYLEITYKGKTQVVNLIAGSIYRRQNGSLDFDAEKAVRELEYRLVTTIYNMTREKTKTLGLLTGHGEYAKEAMSDLYLELDPLYNIIYVDLRQGRSLHPKDLDLLLVMQPQKALREREKYEIDQYLMRGGRIIWCLDHEIVDFSIGEQGSTLTDLRQTNLDDFFMMRGVKVNYNIVQDLKCGFIDALSYTTTFGNSMNQKPWPFNPLLTNLSDHPITRYQSNALIRIGGSIDTFPTEGIKKTVLMASSRNTRVLGGRQYINVGQVMQNPPDPARFQDGFKYFGVLLEGKFNSQYVGRQIPTDSIVTQLPNEKFTPTSLPDVQPMMAVISDGEFAIGEYIQGRHKPLPADNKALMQNLIDVMAGEEVITRLRVRELNRRVLDRRAYAGNERSYQILNIALPVLLLIVFGFVREYLRRRRNLSYRKRQS